jgi:hypothetical protein
MIAMCVGEDDSVQALNIFAQHLLPEIWAGSDDQAFAINVQMD